MGGSFIVPTSEDHSRVYSDNILVVNSKVGIHVRDVVNLTWIVCGAPAVAVWFVCTHRFWSGASSTELYNILDRVPRCLG